MAISIDQMILVSRVMLFIDQLLVLELLVNVYERLTRLSLCANTTLDSNLPDLVFSTCTLDSVRVDMADQAVTSDRCSFVGEFSLGVKIPQDTCRRLMFSCRKADY